MENIAIIGSGSWGVAIATHIAKMGYNVKIWSFAKEEADMINKDKKCKFLPYLTIENNITCYTDMEKVVEGTDIIFHVTPSKVTRNVINQYKNFITNQPVIMCSKGFESSSLLMLSQVMDEELPNVPKGVFSGPSHAEEVSIGIPTAIVIASEDDNVLKLVQDNFMNEKMRIYTSKDITGVEIGGALKNIIAFCAGIAVEIDTGSNTFAALATRGLVEITRLGEKMGANKETFYGLSGLGDLLVTCMSDLSRNRRAGRCIGRGLTIEETKKEIGMTIESIDNIDVAYRLAKKYDVEMPIVETAYNVLYNGLKPKEALIDLMSREKKAE